MEPSFKVMKPMFGNQLVTADAHLCPCHYEIAKLVIVLNAGWCYFFDHQTRKTYDSLPNSNCVEQECAILVECCLIWCTRFFIQVQWN